MSNVRRAPFAELADDPEFKAITELYALESKIEGMPDCDWQRETYQHMENVGLMKTLIATNDQGKVIGFMLMLVTVLPHYNRICATTESIFVLPDHRKGGAGVKLIKEAEAWAKELGAVGILLSAPKGGRLEAVAPRLGYTATNTALFKGLL